MFCSDCKNCIDTPGSVCGIKTVSHFEEKTMKNCGEKCIIKNCLSCTYAIQKEYEEDIEYKCTLQNNKVMIRTKPFQRSNITISNPCSLGLYEYKE